MAFLVLAQACEALKVSGCKVKVLLLESSKLHYGFSQTLIKNFSCLVVKRTNYHFENNHLLHKWATQVIYRHVALLRIRHLGRCANHIFTEHTPIIPPHTQSTHIK